MEQLEKKFIKVKFGLGIQRIIDTNKLKAKENKIKGIKDHKIVTSLRKLAAASGVEFSIIQKIVAGKRNPELTTIISIADGLGISEANLFTHFSIVPDNDVRDAIAKEEKINVNITKRAKSKK